MAETKSRIEKLDDICAPLVAVKGAANPIDAELGEKVFAAQRRAEEVLRDALFAEHRRSLPTREVC